MPASPCHSVPAERERPGATPQSVPRNASECLRAATGIATEISDNSLSRREGHQAPRAANAVTTARIVMTIGAAAAALYQVVLDCGVSCLTPTISVAQFWSCQMYEWR